MPFEHKKKPIISQGDFVRRQIKYALYTTILVVISLLIGMIGYHYSAGLSWLDSLYNSSMILTGMGPVNILNNDSAKWFASFYALYSGVAFLTMAGVLLAPMIHRILHILHVEDSDR
jgi:hypothetical protein